MKTNVLIITCLLLVLSLNAQYAIRNNYGAKFEKVGKILHGAGQSREIEFSSYANYLGNDKYPNISMYYTRVDYTANEQETRINGYLANINNHPNGVMLKLGLSFTNKKNGNYANEVIAGQHDNSLIRLASVLNTWGNPVFVRIGFEANGPWNKYEASSFKQAFRHISNIFNNNASNIASVWNVHPTSDINKIMSFYPGDNYVDWWSINLFERKYINPLLNNSGFNNTQDFLDRANVHLKPVMIGESFPVDVGVNDGPQSWDDWYVPFFNIIKNNPGIKAFCYINRNWIPNTTQTWLDGRVYRNNFVGGNYKQELNHPAYEHLTVPTNYRIAALNPTDDSYVRDGSYSNVNYNGSDSQRLHIKNSPGSGFTREGYLAFNISGISNILSAKLYFFARNDNMTDFSIGVFSVPNGDSWSETTLTWNNKPNTGNSLGQVQARSGRREWRG
ncbi:MAG: DNRLRE domain-containing protein, partial [Cyclobacteriaceae bacterium]